MKSCRELCVVDVRLKILLVAAFVVPAEVQTAQPPKILSKRTLIDVDDDDIAHFACEAHGIPKPSITWEKDRIELKESIRGISLLTTRGRNITTQESHLFIAVTGEYRRGEYLCVASNEQGVTSQSFSVRETPPSLTTEDNIAISLSIFLTLIIISTITVLLRRRMKQLKKEKKTLKKEEKKSTAKRQRPRLDTIEEEEKESFIPKTDPDDEKIVDDGTNKSRSCEIQVDIH